MIIPTNKTGEILYNDDQWHNVFIELRVVGGGWRTRQICPSEGRWIPKYVSTLPLHEKLIGELPHRGVQMDFDGCFSQSDVAGDLSVVTAQLLWLTGLCFYFYHNTVSGRLLIKVLGTRQQRDPDQPSNYIFLSVPTRGLEVWRWRHVTLTLTVTLIVPKS